MSSKAISGKPTSSRKRSKRNVPVGSRNLLGYHSSKSTQPEDKVTKARKLNLYGSNGLESQGNLGVLTKESRRCLRNLAAYRPPKEAFPQPWLPFPRSRRAAVLVALFVGRKGDLYVLLSKRASTLRSFAGDTCLPGGKMDPEDRTIEDTARREAFEEIGLPLDPKKAPLLCKLEPFYVITQLLVTPVVVLILDHTIQPILNSAEVTALFSHPLASFLSSAPPASIIRTEPELVELGGDDYRYHNSNDWNWDGPPVWSPAGDTATVGTYSRPMRMQRRERSGIIGRPSQTRNSPPSASRSDSHDKANLPMVSAPRKRKIRMHSFLTGREAGGIKPVYGLTAAILIKVAQIGYSLSPPALATPDFQLDAPDGPSHSMRIAWAFYRPPTSDKPNFLREALEEEGLADRVDWVRVREIAGVVDVDVAGFSSVKKDRLRDGNVPSRASLHPHDRAPRIRSKL